MHYCLVQEDELVTVVKGTMEFSIGGDRCVVEAGDEVFIPAGGLPHLQGPAWCKGQLVARVIGRQLGSRKGGAGCQPPAATGSCLPVGLASPADIPPAAADALTEASTPQPSLPCPRRQALHQERGRGRGAVAVRLRLSGRPAAQRRLMARLPLHTPAHFCFASLVPRTPSAPSCCTFLRRLPAAPSCCNFLRSLLDSCVAAPPPVKSACHRVCLRVNSCGGKRGRWRASAAHEPYTSCAGTTTREYTQHTAGSAKLSQYSLLLAKASSFAEPAQQGARHRWPRSVAQRRSSVAAPLPLLPSRC